MREFLAKEIGKIKQKPKQGFFSQKDFELVFETYNNLGQNEVKVAYLAQGTPAYLALRTVGIQKDEAELVASHKELQKSAFVARSVFIEILQNEYYKKYDFT